MHRKTLQSSQRKITHYLWGNKYLRNHYHYKQRQPGNSGKSLRCTKVLTPPPRRELFKRQALKSPGPMPPSIWLPLNIHVIPLKELSNPIWLLTNKQETERCLWCSHPYLPGERPTAAGGTHPTSLWAVPSIRPGPTRSQLKFSLHKAFRAGGWQWKSHLLSARPRGAYPLLCK